MNRRTKLFTLLGAGLIAIVIIIVFFIMQEKDQVKTVEDSETSPVETIEVPADQKDIIKKAELTAEDKVASAIKPVAIAFVERFGTYTNHSDYVSIQDLAPIMTNTMTSWVEVVYIPKLKEEHDVTGFFYRIKAEAPVVVVTEELGDSARVKVTAKRMETIGDAETKEFLQDIELELVKINEEWLINGAFWEERR